MIRDLSESLRELLAPALPTADISFDRPTDQFQPTQTTVNLFLYDVRENVELRNNEPILRREGGQSRKEPPPLRTDCFYLVTAWPVGGPNLALQEHGLLSQALRRLAAFPRIPDEFLQGSLVGQRPPLPAITARPDGVANPPEFWTALGNRLRVALTLTVTISLPVFEDITAPLVLTKRSGFTPTAGPVDEELVQIGGRILAPATVVGAAANLASAAGRQATLQVTADAANFRPGDVVFLQDSGDGAHTDRVAVAGLSGATVTFQRDLTPPPYPAGSTMRIADLTPQQTRIRLDRITGLESGAEIRLVQDQTSEFSNVREVDRATGSVTLDQVRNTYSMLPADPPLSVQYGVSGALVEAVDAGLHTVSRSDGRYTFVRIPRGPQTLQVTAAGFQPVPALAIQVPAAANQDYDVVLTPL
ncbi:MAG: Pvc16 family protein [Planctomycetota bacterium]|nr:Pvc16 family protein [Planctomycetota bacterium]